jgi:hypothetical protein
MNTLQSVIELDVIHPKTLSRNELQEVQEIIQDIFAETSHECMICTECHHAFGKKELFADIPTEWYRESVYTILESGV